MPDIQLFAVLQLEPAILRHTIFVTAAHSDMYGDHVLRCGLYCLYSPLIDIRADDAVAMAGIHQDIRGPDAQFFFDPPRTLGR